MRNLQESFRDYVQVEMLDGDSARLPRSVVLECVVEASERGHLVLAKAEGDEKRRVARSESRESG